MCYSASSTHRVEDDISRDAYRGSSWGGTAVHTPAIRGEDLSLWNVHVHTDALDPFRRTQT